VLTMPHDVRNVIEVFRTKAVRGGPAGAGAGAGQRHQGEPFRSSWKPYAVTGSGINESRRAQAMFGRSGEHPQGRPQAVGRTSSLDLRRQEEDCGLLVMAYRLTNSINDEGPQGVAEQRPDGCTETRRESWPPSTV
jgi:hypothetical protein